MLWFDEGSTLRESAILALTKAALSGSLYASHISIWELGVALDKKTVTKRPNLRGLDPGQWFLQTARRLGVNPLPISIEIAAEAALIPSMYGSGDPGDCFLIATAHLHNLTLITRDSRILALSAKDPTYLQALAC